MQTPRAPLDVWLAQLESYSPHEIVLGLERVDLLLERLQLELPETLLLVGGTNGKGSSVAMLDAILSQSAQKVGAYTSPHILRYNERIRVAGVEASDAQIIAAFERVEAARGDVPLTYFEFGTLAALVVFSEAKVDVAVLEVGMGGRLDAVNAVEPTASLITNIALDHCAWLGDTIEAIAAEKAGIMRPGKAVVFAAADVPKTISDAAAALGAELQVAMRDYRWSREGAGWSWQGAGLVLSDLALPAMPGAIQLQNAAGVIALLAASGYREWLTPERVSKALASVRLNGRMQAVADGWLLDVAHNPAAATELAAMLAERDTGGKTTLILGMLDDKDVEGVVKPLAGLVDHWIAVRVAHSRAIAASELARRIANATDGPCVIAPSIESALLEAETLRGPGGRVLVTGSFYLVGPVLQRADSLYSPR